MKKSVIYKIKNGCDDMEEKLQFLLNQYRNKLDDCHDREYLPIIHDGTDVVEYLWDVKYKGTEIEALSDNEYNIFKKIASDHIEEFKDILYDYEHPWSDWDNCDADFYGVF